MSCDVFFGGIQEVALPQASVSGEGHRLKAIIIAKLSPLSIASPTNTVMQQKFTLNDIFKANNKKNIKKIL